jgi:hypothetical protein
VPVARSDERDVRSGAVKTSFFVILVLFAAAARAQSDVINADRPGIADGSATLHRGMFQIETGIERDDAGSERTLSTPTLLRYGVTDAVELRIEGAGFQRVTTPQSSENAWAPLSAGLKVHFRDAPSLGLITRVFVPSGSGASRTKNVTGDIRFAADFNLGDHWSLNPNVGVAFEEDDRRFTAALAALTVQYNISETSGVFIDGAVQTPEERGGTSALMLDTGAALIVGRNTQFDVSVGWGAHGNTTPNVFWSAGVSRRF